MSSTHAVADHRAQPARVVGEEDPVGGRVGEVEVEGAAGPAGERPVPRERLMLDGRQVPQPGLRAASMRL